MARRKRQTYFEGAFTHRRTESDYMGVLPDVVPLEDWREIVATAVEEAKNGDTSARTFLAQYVVGRPEPKAPAPVTVVVQQLSGRDPLVDKLVEPHISRLESPFFHLTDDTKDAMRAQVADEMRALEGQRFDATEASANADGTGDSGEKPLVRAYRFT